MPTRIALLCCLSATILLACKNEAGVPATLDQGEILPLATGNSWEFLRVGYDSDGVAVYSSSLLMTVSQPDTFGTEKGYPLSNFPFVFVDPGPLLWTNKSGGLYNVIPGPGRVSSSLIKVLSYPTTFGDSITFSGHIVRTASLSDGVVVPGGSFDCIRYDILQNGSLRGRLYVVPKIGIVKVWQRYHGVSAQVDALRSYHLH